MGPPPPPATPLRRGAADIAAAADDPPPPPTAASPTRLNYLAGSVRNASPRRAVEGVSSPRRNKPEYSPSRRLVGRPSPSGAAVCDLFAVTPRASSATRLTSFVITDEQAVKLATVIKSIRERPLSEKRAILPLPPKRKAKAAPKKKANPLKAEKPKLRPPTKAQKKDPIINGAIISSPILRGHVFGVREEPLSYSKAEMLGHDRAFQRQLRFRFEQKRLGRDLGGLLLELEGDLLPEGDVLL